MCQWKRKTKFPNKILCIQLESVCFVGFYRLWLKKSTIRTSSTLENIFDKAFLAMGWNYHLLFKWWEKKKLKRSYPILDAYITLEKAWMKTNRIILQGDFNCDLVNTFGETGSDVWSKTRKLLHLFEQFNMQNNVEEPTRVTLELTKTTSTVRANGQWVRQLNWCLPSCISFRMVLYTFETCAETPSRSAIGFFCNIPHLKKDKLPG